MTISKFLMWAAALVFGAATLASCSKTDARDAGDNDGAVRFTAGVTGQAVAAPVSRAAGTDWTAGDEVGIFMVDNPAGTTVLAENRQYKSTAGATATFTPDSEGEKIYYPMDGSAVNFIAYYPYNGSATLGTAIDVEIGTTQNNATQPTFDLLYAKATGTAGAGYTKKTTGEVALTFDHMLSKLVMNCKPGEGVDPADLTGMTVTIKGMNTKSTFDLSAGTLGTAATVAPITPRTITDGSQYDAIILPCGPTAAKGVITVEFTIEPDGDAETFTWQMEAGTDFKGGNEYTYTVTLDRTEVTATGTINPWTTTGNDRGPVTAE